MIVAALLLATLAPLTDWATVVKPVAKQVPRIQIQRADGHSVCSGVVIDADKGFVLTAAHCTGPLKGRDEISLTVNERHAELARVNEILDLAILRFKPRDEIAMPLAPETPAAGTEVAVVGFLLSAETLHTQFGHIAARRDKDGAVVIDSTVLPGDSGGAIIDNQGRLIAMTNQYYRGTALGLAVPVEIVRDFVEPYMPKTK